MTFNKKSRLEHLGSSAFLLLGLVPVLLGGTILWSIVQFRAEVDQVEHSHQALTAIANLEASTTAASSSVRGYFVTGDPSYLEDFDRSRRDASSSGEVLLKLTRQDPHQVSTIKRLVAAVAERMDFLRMASELRKAGQSLGAINATQGAAGRRLIAAIQASVEMARAEELRLLNERALARRKIQIAAALLCGAAMLMGMMVALGGEATIRKYRALRDRADQELKSANATLEQRVAERTRELERTNSELSQAKTELQRTADALRHSNAGLESFAYAASHELQEPLRTITSCLQVLRTRLSGLDADSESFLSFAIGGAARMKELMANLLLYSRVVHELKPAPVSLEAVLHRVLLDLQSAIEESRARLPTKRFRVSRATRAA